MTEHAQDTTGAFSAVALQSAVALKIATMRLDRKVGAGTVTPEARDNAVSTLRRQLGLELAVKFERISGEKVGGYDAALALGNQALDDHQEAAENDVMVQKEAALEPVEA